MRKVIYKSIVQTQKFHNFNSEIIFYEFE